MDRYELCKRLAREGGVIAHRGFGTAPATMKGRHDVVTEMDREVERFIRAGLAKHFPDDSIVGEEEGGRGGGDRVWLIDPIDGTANYARGIPHYCVSIGLVEHGEPVLGAIYDPSCDWLYSGARGRGAWLNDRPIRVSAIDEIDAATVECGWSTRRPADAYLSMVTRLFQAGAQVRRAGSGALGLADVAAGRSEAYAELHINAWDVAAGIPIVREAGGRVNAFFAGDGIATGNPVVATNAALSDKLAGIIGVPLER
jgi:myo-inositol-1(or 4)-monophosphatase